MLAAGGSADSGTLTTRDGVRLHWTARGSGKRAVVVPGAWLLAGRLGLSAESRVVVFYDMRSRGRSERVEDPERLERLEEMREEGMDEADPVAYCRAYWRAMLPLYTAGPEAAGRLAGELDMGCELPNEQPAAFRRILERVSAELEGYDWREEARTLELPVLVLHGTEDHVAPVDGGREWAAVLPDGRFEAVEGAGHLLWAERPGRVRALITRFLAPTDSGRDSR